MRDETSVEPVVLAAGADDGYAMPLAVMLYSALKNLGDRREAEVYIMDGGIREAHRRRIERVIGSFDGLHLLRWIRVDAERLEGIEITEPYSVTNYFPLLLPDLVPEKKVIFLDSDMVVRGDLGQLWDRDVGDDYLLAVPNEPAPNREKRELLELPRGTKYLNSGLLVLNLEKWRTDDFGRQVIAFSERKGRQLTHVDQDALNGVLKGDWGELPPRWNVLYRTHRQAYYHRRPWAKRRYEEAIEIVNNAQVIHYSSQRKPWRASCDHPAKTTFYRYLRASGWHRGAAWYAWWIPRKFSLRPYWWKVKRRGRRLKKRIRRWKAA